LPAAPGSIPGQDAGTLMRRGPDFQLLLISAWYAPRIKNGWNRLRRRPGDFSVFYQEMRKNPLPKIIYVL
jgi:hypothetical protein